jgi:hypothetical protein
VPRYETVSNSRAGRFLVSYMESRMAAVVSSVGVRPSAFAPVRNWDRATGIGQVRRETVQRGPLAIRQLPIEVHDGMDLPQRAPVPVDAVGMHLIEHQPATNSYPHVRVAKGGQGFILPVGMVHTNARRDLDNDALRLRVTGILREPQVEVLVARVARIAVRRLGDLELVCGEIAFDLDGGTLVARDFLRLALAPLIAKAVSGPDGPREPGDQRPRHRDVVAVVDAVLPPIERIVRL